MRWGEGGNAVSLRTRFCSVSPRDRRSARRFELFSARALHETQAEEKYRAFWIILTKESILTHFWGWTDLYILNGLPQRLLSPTLLYLMRRGIPVDFLRRRHALLQGRWEQGKLLCLTDCVLLHYQSIMWWRIFCVQDRLRTAPLPSAVPQWGQSRGQNQEHYDIECLFSAEVYCNVFTDIMCVLVRYQVCEE